MGEPTPGRAGRPPKYYLVEPRGAKALLAAYEDLQSVAGGIVPELTALAAKRSSASGPRPSPDPASPGWT